MALGERCIFLIVLIKVTTQESEFTAHLLLRWLIIIIIIIIIIHADSLILYESD